MPGHLPAYPFLFSPTLDRSIAAGTTERYRYIHSKFYVFDDAFCTIGSMNTNMRSTTHDSELCIGYYEPGTYSPLSFGCHAASRMAAWQHHLGLADGDLHWIADGADAITKLWSQVRNGDITLPDGSPVTPNVDVYDWSDDLSEELMLQGAPPGFGTFLSTVLNLATKARSTGGFADVAPGGPPLPINKARIFLP